MTEQTTSSETAREWVAERIEAHYEYGVDVGRGAIPPAMNNDTAAMEEADRVIADLWDRALDPATVEVVAIRLHNEELPKIHAWNEMSDFGQDYWRGVAKGHITALLTALIGPKPESEANHDHP